MRWSLLVTVVLLILAGSLRVGVAGEVTTAENAPGPGEVARVLAIRQAEQEAVDGQTPFDAASLGAWLRADRWSPYVVGIGLGILSWIVFLVSDHPLGASGAYARSSGMIEQLLRGRSVEEKAYFREHPPSIDWEWMLVLGMFLGAFLSAWLSESLTLDWTPPLWEAGFGNSPVLRVLVGLLGGLLLGLGSRWANGCTSGHGLSGTMQMVASSWVAVACFFVGGVATALLIYRVFL